MIDINPIVNQNLSGDGQADYKASPIGNGSSKITALAMAQGSGSFVQITEGINLNKIGRRIS